MQNHLIDPTFFYDAIDEFAFTYRIFILSKKEIDGAGKQRIAHTESTISGSLQSKDVILSQSLEGNATPTNYRFYCKSLYQLNIGDIIEYKDMYLRVDGVRDLDEFGVRSASLSMLELTGYRNLQDYFNYLNGVEYVWYL